MSIWGTTLESLLRKALHCRSRPLPRWRPSSLGSFGPLFLLVGVPTVVTPGATQSSDPGLRRGCPHGATVLQTAHLQHYRRRSPHFPARLLRPRPCISRRSDIPDLRASLAIPSRVCDLQMMFVGSGARNAGSETADTIKDHAVSRMAIALIFTIM
jgi:hypothetical protein